MTRVCLKNEPEITGTIIRDGKRDNEVVVRWDGNETTWQIGRDRLVELATPEDQVVVALYRLSDDFDCAIKDLSNSFHLAIGCAIDDIKRVR